MFLLRVFCERCIPGKWQTARNGGFSGSRTQGFGWYSRSKVAQLVENFERSDRPSPSPTDENMEEVRQVKREGRRCTVNDVRNSFGRSYETDRRVLTEDLNMLQTPAKFVAHLLNDDLT
jgi:hypothetical protein